LWKEVKTQHERTLEWVVGPYANLSECEQDRDRLANVIATGAASSGHSTIRLFCVPDSVNPRVDSRWR
jgi:hypothetical protein